MDVAIGVSLGLLIILISPVFSLPSRINKYSYKRKLANAMILGLNGYTWYPVYRGYLLAAVGEIIVVVFIIIAVSRIV